MAFKMKRTPIKGKLDNFFSSLGEQLRAGQKDRGIFSEKGKAEKKSRKAGESKFQADNRRRGEARKSAKAGEKAKKTINTDFVKDINSPTNTKPGELKVNEELMSKEVKKATTPEPAKQTFKQAFASAKKADKETFEWKGNPYTTKLKEEPLPVDDVDLRKYKKSKRISDQRKFRVDKDQDNIRDAAQGTTSYDPYKHISSETFWERHNKSDKQKELKKLSQLADGSAFNKKSPTKKKGYKMPGKGKRK